MQDRDLDHAARELRKGARSAGDHGEAAFNEIIAVAERSFADAARRAERVIKEAIDSFRAEAGDRAKGAQRYVLAEVKDKPLAVSLAALGVGILVGLLLASHND